jgi:nucleotidyltransferase substrate binding protein (TIGR01987 family)
MTFELAWKVMKEYLEAEGYIVKSPRETIKQAYQIGLIEDGHIWIDALTKRNLITHTYDESFANKFVANIQQVYFSIFKALYDKLSGM